VFGVALAAGVDAGVETAGAGVDWLVPVPDVVPESEVPPLPVVGVETVELSLVLEVPEFVPDVAPVTSSLALCANAGSNGMTIASVRITKKTAQPVVARLKKYFVIFRPPSRVWYENIKYFCLDTNSTSPNIGFTRQYLCLHHAIKEQLFQIGICAKL
jgi:hypothetical protein